MKGLILAAGRGTRLRPLTDHVSKPMIPLAGRPLICYALDKLTEIGVTDIGIVVGDNEDELRSGIHYPAARLTYIRQPQPLGLAHAVNCAHEFTGNDDFVMLLCDNVFEASLRESLEQWEQMRGAQRGECLLHVRTVENPSAYGVAVVDDGVVTQLEEKPLQPRSNLAIAGLYFFTPRIYEAIGRIKPSARGELEITDAIGELMAGGNVVRARELRGYWFDTGTVEDLKRAEEAVRQ